MRERLIALESENYDVSYTVRQKDFEINELTIAVNDLRGKLYGGVILLKEFENLNSRFQRETDAEEGVKDRRQIRQAEEERGRQG